MNNKFGRIKITRTISYDNAEKLRTKAFQLRKSESAILDDLLRGI